MKSVDPGVLSHSYCFSFTPSELSRKMFYYPTWCGRYFCSSEYYIKRETYPEMLLVYVRAGEFHVHYQEQTHVVRKGEIFLIDCQLPHYYQASDGLEFLYIHFDGLNAHELCRYIIAQHGFIFQGEKCVEIGALLYDLTERCQKDEIISAANFSLLIYQIIIQLVQRESNPSRGDNAIDIAIRYIRENVGKTLSLAELSERVGLSKYHFSHVFKAETGYSPIEYVISTRLDRAKLLLKTSDLSIAEISYEVGYENPGSFINLFTNKVGSSPKNFRKT